MREVKNAAENQAPMRDHRRKKKKQAPDKVWQEDVDSEQRNRSGVNGRRDQIWEGGAEDERGSGHGQSGLERPKRGKPRERATARAWGEWDARVPLTLVLVRLPWALARRGGLTASAIDPAMAQSPLVFVKTLRVPQPADFLPPDCHMIESPPLRDRGGNSEPLRAAT